MRAEIGRLEEEIRNAYGIADVLDSRVCTLKRATESLSVNVTDRYGFCDDHKVLVAVADVDNAYGAMYEAMRHAQCLTEYLEKAVEALKKAQKGLK